MVDTAYATAAGTNKGFAQEALQMLCALDAGGRGGSVERTDGFRVEARSSLDAERLELLECLRQELRRAPEGNGGKAGREVCVELLTHLAGGAISWRSETIQ